MLSISNLSKTYSNGVKALDSVTINVGKGVFGLLGPNGAGKSSLLRTIATLQEPDEGTVHFEGIDVLAQKDEMRRNLGYLPQEFGVYPAISAEEMLHHLGILKGMTHTAKRKEAVENLLKTANLWQHRKKKLGGFSGGMRQRFGIAQALLGAPRLIIVDEPTAGLDPEERDRFHNLLCAVAENTAVILSTHIVSDVSELSNDMAILHNGKILLHMSPYEALGVVRGKIWKGLFSKVEAEALIPKNRISSRLHHGKLAIKVFSEEAPGFSFESVEPDLEDVYFSFIKGYIHVPVPSLV